MKPLKLIILVKIINYSVNSLTQILVSTIHIKFTKPIGLLLKRSLKFKSWLVTYKPTGEEFSSLSDDSRSCMVAEDFGNIAVGNHRKTVLHNGSVQVGSFGK